jgi:putative oxidoreductase
MKMTRNAAALAGRIMLALMFVIAGFGKIPGFADTSVMMTGAGLPFANVLLVLTILIELGGGAAIMVGWKTRPIALVVFLFTALATLVFHAFWNAPPEKMMLQQLMFMKNVSVMGGLLLLWTFGPGDYALDDKRD